MSHSVRRHLRLEIDAYDETIRRFIPGYEAMVAVAADSVAAIEPDLVCDLGAGTGALAEALLERAGVGIVELLDVDAEMLSRARQRLARFGDRARYSLRSYDGPFSRCDAFAASISLHHIPTIEAKSALYARAFASLRPGGVLVNADPYMPFDSCERDRLFRYWADHLVASGIAEARAWKHFEEWAEEDTYFPLDVELDALTSIGFEVECAWTDGPMVVVVATKRHDQAASGS
jgi:SAM-dependent methyltransferase